MGISWSNDGGPDTEPEGIPPVNDNYDRIERRAAASAHFGIVLLCTALISAVGIVLTAWLLR